MISSKSFVSTVVVAALLSGMGAGSAFAARKKAVANDTVTQQPKAVASASVAENVIDTFDTAQGWESYTDNGAKVTFTAVPGKIGKAMEAAYDFGTGGWVAFSKKNDKDFSKVKGIKYWYKGDGSMNSIELKLEDEDGSNFGALATIKSNNKGWTLIEVPFDQMKYWWGGNQEMNWSKVTRIHLGVSKKDGDEGGAGKATFDQLELMK